MTVLTKLTPAQIVRLRQVQSGWVKRYRHESVALSSFEMTYSDGRSVSLDPGKCPMWITLTRGGMVKWEPSPPPYEFQAPYFKAVLTPEGAALLAKHSVLKKKVTR
jgi:hypothetical protein